MYFTINKEDEEEEEEEEELLLLLLMELFYLMPYSTILELKSVCSFGKIASHNPNTTRWPNCSYLNHEFACSPTISQSLPSLIPTWPLVAIHIAYASNPFIHHLTTCPIPYHHLASGNYPYSLC